MKTLAEDPTQDLPMVKLSKGRLFFCMTILYLLFASDVFARLGINSLFPIIQEDLNLSDVQIGSLGSLVLLGMMVFVLPIAYLADTVSKRGTIVGMGATWSLGTILCGMFPTFGVIALGRFMVGAGNSSYAPASVSTLTNWFPRKKWGTVISIYNTSISLGIAGGMYLTGLLATHYSWQTVFIMVGIPSLILSFLAFFLPKEIKAKSTEQKKSSVKEIAQTFMKTKSLLFAALGSGFFNVGGNALITFGSIFFVREMDMTIAQAASIMGLAMAVGIVGGPVGGIILDFFTRKNIRSRGFVPAAYMILAGILTIASIMLKSIPLYIMGMFVMAMLPSCYHVVTQEIVPPKYRASSYGALVILLQLGGTLGSLLAGILSSVLGIQIALVITTSLFFVSALSFICVAMCYKKDFSRLQTFLQEEQSMINHE